ncbi:MAG TPA: HTH domain-containing protein [Micromonosporaceae bacterium]|nr:HTH domain-containing protein [Micromonosporaceae bacterium]
MVAVDASDLSESVEIPSVVSWPGRRRGPRRLVGPASVPGMVQLHQAIPIVERQHALIEELRARAPGFVRGTDLASRTGTTVRTVERDLARLTDAGVPIEVRRGPGGGYRINTRASLPPLRLTPGEVSALIASLVAVGPYVSATAQTALGKLLAALAVEDA